MRVTQNLIDEMVQSMAPERLSLEARPPITDDHVAHISQLARMGQTSLAADHLLFAQNSAQTLFFEGRHGFVNELAPLEALNREG